MEIKYNVNSIYNIERYVLIKLSNDSYSIRYSNSISVFKSFIKNYIEITLISIMAI